MGRQYPQLLFDSERWQLSEKTFIAVEIEHDGKMISEDSGGGVGTYACPPYQKV